MSKFVHKLANAPDGVIFLLLDREDGIPVYRGEATVKFRKITKDLPEQPGGAKVRGYVRSYDNNHGAYVEATLR